MAAMMVVMLRRFDTRQRDLDSTGPDDAVLNRSSNACRKELLDFGDVLKLCTGTEQGGRAKLEVEVRVEGEVKGGVGVRWFAADGAGSGGRGELDGESAGEAFESEGEGDGEDGESRSGEVHDHAGGDGDGNAVGVVEVEFDALYTQSTMN